MPRQSILSNKSKVKEAIDYCSSVKECLNYLGLRAAGGNYKQFYLWCDRHGLVPPKGDNTLGLRQLAKKKQIPLDQILKVGSPYNRQSLKRRLIEESLLENKCYECNILPEWNGKPLSLQIDHINGIANDNRLENLRILCPNCHSQTQTFAGRRKKYSRSQVHYCTHCYVSITRFAKSGLCKRCASIRSNFKKRKVKRPSRKELHKLVWSKPTTLIAKQMGVSDKAIEKWCKYYDIPKPPRGYWNKHTYSRTDNYQEFEVVKTYFEESPN